jgi:hypothetical protein
MVHPVIRALSLLGSLAVCASSFAEGKHWPLEDASPEVTIHGSAGVAEGVRGNSLALDGWSVVELKDSAGLNPDRNGFTVSAWFNPYGLTGDQQMIVGKNRYSLNERQWGILMERDGEIRAYLRDGGWKTIASDVPFRPGHWCHAALIVGDREVRFFVNGKLAGELVLENPISSTEAPITLGGIREGGNLRQQFFGAIDEVRYEPRLLTSVEVSKIYEPVSFTHEIPLRSPVSGAQPDPALDEIEEQHAKEDRSALIFDGRSPDKLACDTTLRKMPDGSWVMIMLGGGDTEPVPENRVFLTRSLDEGETWSPLKAIDLGVKSENPKTALVPSELMVHRNRCTMFVATHDGTFGDWKEWMTLSDDSGRTWSELKPVPGRLHDRTFVRNHIVTRDGRILLPFQHYVRVGETREISNGRRFSPPTNPRNGVLMSEDGGKTWAEYGNIRLSKDDNYHGWAENNIVELSDGRIGMIIRADRLGGVLYYAESHDGGRTWPEFAKRTDIPNPGSKATLYPLGGDTVALLHNPNPRRRSPLALWVSFDGMKTWPYQRILLENSKYDFGGRFNYPDGFVSEDGKWLHFAFDYSRFQAVYVGARLPD